jgi:Cu/Ag efflux protein CusF
MSLLGSWDRYSVPDPKTSDVKYGKIASITDGKSVSIKFGSKNLYAIYDDTVFPDLKVGDQVAFIMPSKNPQKVFIVRKVKNQYTEFALNKIVD